MKHRIWMLMLVVLLMLGMCTPGFASEAPYKGYTYNTDGEERQTPVLYMPVMAVAGHELTGKEMAAPGDLMIFANRLYVLDSGNSRLIITDLDLKPLGELLFSDTEGMPMEFAEAAGLYISETGIYLSDIGAEAVYHFDPNGKLIQTYSCPDSPLYDKSIAFRAKRLLVDSAGNLYALVEGQFSGAVMFSAQGEFLGFYGSNEVEMTLDMLLDQSWRQVLSKEQQRAMSRFIPVAYTGFDIDEENFVYTCSQNALSVSNRVRKLNPTGKGLWDGKDLSFGDDIPVGQRVSGLSSTSQLIDLDVKDDGILSVLDAARGRIFQYDDNGTFLGAFGGRGTQIGTFQDPIAIESSAERLYVLDRAKGNVTMFDATEYGQAVHEAVRLYNQGEYASAIPYWQKVIAMDGGSELACLGMGKALYSQGNVDGAMKYLKASNNKEQYSQVFEDYRLNMVRDKFTWIVIGCALLWASIAAAGKYGWFGLGKRLEPVKRHLRVMLHPRDTIYDLRAKKQLSPVFAGVTVLIWFTLDVLQWFGTGFIFSTHKPENFNVLVSLVSTVLFYLLWVLVNWAVTTLSDGKGTAMELFCTSAYALLPYLFGKVLVLILSHLLTLQEGAFLVWIQAATLAWSVLILFSVLSALHHYTFGKTLGSVALTLFGIAIVVFLIFMAVVLFEHVSNLIMIIYNELTLRR